MEPTSTPTNQSQNPNDDLQQVQAQAQAQAQVENAFEGFTPSTRVDGSAEPTVTAETEDTEPSSDVITDYQAQPQSYEQETSPNTATDATDFEDEKVESPVVGYEPEEPAGEVISPSSEPPTEPQMGASDEPTITPDVPDAQDEPNEEQDLAAASQDDYQQSSTNSDEQDQDMAAAAASSAAQLNNNSFDKTQGGEAQSPVIAQDVSSKKGQLAVLLVVTLIAIGVGAFYLL